MFHIQTHWHIGLSLAGVMLLGAALGCGGSAMTPVTGKVTYQGKPVPEGTVTFYPKDGGRPATGKIQPDGTYQLSSLQSGDGVLPGEYAVAIEARRVQGGGALPTSLEEEIKGVGSGSAPPKIEWLVPIEYSSTESSGLTATVKGSGNEIDFQLP